MSSDLAVNVPVTTVWTSPDAPRDIDADAVSDPPDTVRWIESLDKQRRLGLHGRTLTQALLGEPVHLLAEDGGWAEVALPWQPSSVEERGYRGWVDRRHLGPAPAPATLCATVTGLSVEPVDGGAALSYGTVLPVVDVDDRGVRVESAAGRHTLRTEAGVHVAPAGESSADAESLVRLARQFLGVRYLWGGTSGWGIDCSGLVHLTYRALGVTVPRDAFDQADTSGSRPLHHVRHGDLYFFARPGERVYHVGFATSAGTQQPATMLHAPEGGELVEDASMAPDRRAHLIAAGTYLPV